MRTDIAFDADDRVSTATSMPCRRVTDCWRTAAPLAPGELRQSSKTPGASSDGPSRRCRATYLKLIDATLGRFAAVSR